MREEEEIICILLRSTRWTLREGAAADVGVSLTLIFLLPFLCPFPRDNLPRMHLKRWSGGVLLKFV